LEWNQINSVVFLENSHRFRNDPHWGDILERIRTFTFSKEDIETNNTRVLCNSVKLQNNETYFYACPYNHQRNEIWNHSFRRFISTTHSRDSTNEPPNHTIIILADLYDTNNKKHTKKVHDAVYRLIGDAKMNHGTRLIDPRLCLYRSCPVMLSTNENLQSNGFANGSLSPLERICLKTDGIIKKLKFMDIS